MKRLQNTWILKNKMKTLLLNLPWTQNNRLGVRAGSRWPFTSLPEEDGKIHYIPFPFFLAYATALLKKKGYAAKLVDAIAEGITEEAVLGKVKNYEPNILVIETATPSFYNDIKIAEKLHAIVSDCAIVLCGPHAGVFAEEILTQYPFIDFIIRGEYEYVLLGLVRRQEDQADLGVVDGLVWKNKEKIVVNSPRSTITDLDSLPWPEREDVPLYKYNDGFAGLPSPNVQMWASRGCPYSCSFCLWPQTMYHERRYRKRNPLNVADEMEFLIKKFGFRAVYFDDDVFNIDKEYVRQICRHIRRRNISAPWAVMARADIMNRDLLEEMKMAGLYAIKYGVESASDKVLELCDKPMDKVKIIKAVMATKELGIKVHLSFCLGLPGETRQTLDETLKFVQDLKPDSCQVSLGTPFPGTKYFEDVKKRGRLLNENWSNYDGNFKPVAATEGLSCEDLERIKSDLSSNFNFQ